MTSLITYTATCWREGTSWVVRVPQLDRTTRTPRLSEVDAAARRLIGAVSGSDPDHVDVVVDLRVPDGITRLLDEASTARRESDVVSVQAVALRRALARRLTDHGYGVRDVAVLLGISYGRAQQLVSDPVDPLARQRPSVGAVGAVGPVGAVREQAGRPHSSYQHEAFLHRSDDEFLAGTVPFIQDAVALGQPVVVALEGTRLRSVRAALAGTRDVRFVDTAELGGNPARIIPALLDFVQQHEGRPVRGIGEPLRPGRRPEEVVECQLHEGLLNVAIDPDIPLWLRCSYDAAALPPEVSRAALHSHPAVVEVGSYRGSTLYGGLHHVDSLFRSELPPAPAGSAAMSFAGADLSAVRAHVSRCAREAGLTGARARWLTSAVAEIAGNSVRHGGGRGELRTWTQPDALVCQVSDAGTLADPLVGRRTPAPHDEKNRGLWLANQISDLVQLRSTADGSTARVFAWL